MAAALGVADGDTADASGAARVTAIFRMLAGLGGALWSVLSGRASAPATRSPDSAAVPAPPPPAPAASEESDELRPDASVAELYAFCRADKASGKWAGKTLRDADRAADLFKELIGARTARTTTGIDASDFQRLLGRLPAWHGRSIYTGLTADQSIAKADRLEALLSAAAKGDDAAARERDALCRTSTMEPAKLVERLHPKTNNKHITILRAVFAYAEAHHYRRKGTNPFAGLFYSKAKLVKNQRRRRGVWEDSDLRHLFSSPVYRGHGLARHEPGRTITRDALYWAPLLGALNGLRLEEALQLHAVDIRKVDGIWCMRIDGADGKQVKTEGSERTVPMHPVLVRLRLPQLAERVRAQGRRQLFPDLKRGGPDGTFGYVFSKDFAAYRRHIGLGEAGKDFQALRKTVNTSIQRRVRSDAGRHYLLGHQHESVNYRHYFGGFEPADLLAYLNDVHYADDILATIGIAFER